MIQLETYRGTKSRHICPACGCKNQFTRFADDAGNYLADDVGICNRASKCGYRYTAKQFFADNPSGLPSLNLAKVSGKKSRQSNSLNLAIKTKSFDFIAPEHLKATLGNYDRNAFVQFLFDLFPDCSEEIQSVLKMYLVGTYEDYCCFPQIDRLNRVCKAKLIRFNRATGKRLKGDYDTSSLVRKLKLKEDFNYKQIFFGEHLLRRGDVRPVGIVESEKTAIIAHLCFPEFVWLACNSKTWLNATRLERLDGRRIILYPDADGFELWQSIALDAQRQGLTVKVSNLIETFATDEQRASGYDLADYLINQQRERHAHNWRADNYNYKLDKILNDESLFAVFNSILDEQKAIAVYNGSTETEAERLCTQADYVRFAVRSV